jgi:aspartate-semialdehyde dehydrogenase
MSFFTPTSILIFGATGTIGRYITSSLLSSSPPFQRITIFTSLSSLSSKSDLLTSWTSKYPSLAVVAGDLTSESDVTSAYHDSKADTVISCLGRGALDKQIPLLKLAEQSETVKWFLPSEYGTDIEHNEKSPNEKPHQLKLKVRKFVRDEIKRLKVTYVVTGPYFDMWVNAHAGFEKAGGFVVDKKEAYVIEDGEGKVGFCTMRE